MSEQGARLQEKVVEVVDAMKGSAEEQAAAVKDKAADVKDEVQEAAEKIKEELPLTPEPKKEPEGHGFWFGRK